MLSLIIGAAVAAKMVDTVKDIYSESKPVNANYLTIGINETDLENKDYRQVIDILLGKGFTNIETYEIREYRNSFFNRDMYGKVKSVSINGNSSFRKKDVFNVDAYVLISFHVFKDSPPIIIHKLEQLKSRYEFNYAQPHYSEPQYVIINNDKETESFCEYCDCRIEESWFTCKHCGAPIGRKNNK